MNCITRREFLKRSIFLISLSFLSDKIFSFEKEMEKELSTEIPYSPEEDVLIPSTCAMCVNFCGIRVRRVNGVIRAIYGNPESPYNKGHLCPKGQAGIFHTYNPYRIKAPLKRTNPKKGINEDPLWKEITWEEAFEEIVSKLKEVKEKDPRGLSFHWSHGKYLLGDQYTKAFCKAFGTPNGIHRTTVCEAARHVADEITWGYHGILPDLDYTKYFINMGANFAEAEQWARWLDRTLMRRIYDEKDLKMVVVEPRLSNSAAKANEWVPIRPGKDVLFLLAMAKELIKNNFIDREFLINYTNAPFLIGEDQKVLKDEKGNPLVWDEIKNKALPYDEAEKISLDKEVIIDGKKYKTSFNLFKDYVLSLREKEIEEETGIPYERVKKIALEFGKNARIGEFIEIEGQKLRYRPVAIYTFRGMIANENGAQAWRLGLILNMLVGSINAVGGLLIHKADPEHKNRKPSKCEYPPSRVDLQESVFFPHATHNVAQQCAYTYQNPEKYGLPYKPQMAIFYATNRILSTSEIEKQFEGYKNLYSVNINVVLDETSQFADIVLPDKTYLEDFHFSPTRWTPDSEHKAIRQEIVNAYNIPYGIFEILWELAKRLGILDKYIEELNKEWKLKEKKFEVGKDYTSKEATAIIWEDTTGKPFEYALKHGLLAKSLDVKKRYLEDLSKFEGKGKPKINFYAEQLVFTKEKVFEIMDKNENVKKVFMEWFEEDENNVKKILEIKFSPLPLREHSFPTPHKKRDSKEYPFYLITFKRMYRNQTDAHALNPVLNEVAKDSSSNFVLINSKIAKKMGIKDEDEVYVESKIGKVKGKAKLTEGIRPDTVAISYHYGRFAKSFPEYAKKGVLPNFIIEYHPDIISGENSFNDTKVKIYKA
jgi:anaerobic selenocysteine-containing dehydrogenase